MNEEIKWPWPRITKDTPMPELKRIHQMMWDYAIKYGEKPETSYFYGCAPCEYVRRFGGRSCSECPIAWPGGKCVLNQFGGLYSQWRDAEGDEKTALAKQIRDLPWKYELEEHSMKNTDLEKLIETVSEMNSRSGVPQSVFVIEECSELIKELMKDQRGKGSEKKIVEEACDVLATIFVMFAQYGVSSDDVETQLLYKYNRALERYRETGEI